MNKITSVMIVLLLGISACTAIEEKTEKRAEAQAKVTPKIQAEDNRQQLEQAVESNTVQAMIQQAIAHAKATVKTTNINSINEKLRPYDREYFPVNDSAEVKAVPTLLFFHGCSGPTLSHEQDWAKRFNENGIAVIAPDSYSGRGINWTETCDLKVMTPWQRSADVLATIQSVLSDPRVDANNLYLAGFSHGAITLWSSLVQVSKQQLPIGLDKLPDINFEQRVKAVFLFYGTCMDNWDLDVNATLFLGENDQYIDESVCQSYAKNHPENNDNLTLKIYPNATHTFDHQHPNAANVAAGSVFDQAATNDAWQTMLSVIKKESN